MEADGNASAVKQNREENRFELQEGERLAYIRYFMRGESIYVLVHTEVPEGYQGTRLATRLVHEALEMIKAEGAQIAAQCPLVKKYLKRHPEYQGLVA